MSDVIEDNVKKMGSISFQSSSTTLQHKYLYTISVHVVHLLSFNTMTAVIQMNTKLKAKMLHLHI